MERRGEIDHWMAEYVRAWSSDREEEISALFTDQARYYTEPYKAPLVGRERIASWWVGQGEAHSRWSFDYEVIAAEGDLFVVRGRTVYPDNLTAAGRPEVYHNLWLVTLADDGRARDFVEYWMSEE